MKFTISAMLIITALTTVTASAEESCSVVRQENITQVRTVTVGDQAGTQTRPVQVTIEVCDGGAKRVRTALRGPWSAVSVG